MDVNTSDFISLPGDKHPIPPSKDTHLYALGGKEESAQTISTLGFRIVGESKQDIPQHPMRSYAPTHPTATEIANKIVPDPRLKALTESQKQMIVDKCIQGYQESVQAFETIVGELAAQHPDAQNFAAEMVQRISKIAKAYQEILAEEYKSATPPMKELKIRLGTALEFTTYGDGTGAGSIGFNPIAIEKAIAHGTLREHMLLIYASLWTALPKIFNDPEMVDKINAKLQNFQINTEALNAKRAAASDKSTPVETFFAQAKPLADFRNGSGRIADSHRPREPAFKLKDIKDLTIREARATLGRYISEQEFAAMKEGTDEGKNLGEHRVQWVRGKDLFRVNENSDFSKRAVAMGGLPIITGPSGTTDGYLLGINYLNMQGYENQGILALIGWMVRSGDHSYHEIKEAGTWHGIDYVPGPDAFKEVYQDDSHFQEQLESAMLKQGKDLPGQYLTGDFQVEVAKQLSFL